MKTTTLDLGFKGNQKNISVLFSSLFVNRIILQSKYEKLNYHHVCTNYIFFRHFFMICYELFPTSLSRIDGSMLVTGNGYF